MLGIDHKILQRELTLGLRARCRSHRRQAVAAGEDFLQPCGHGGGYYGAHGAYYGPMHK